MKPVSCGCGGKSIVSKFEIVEQYNVHCDKCYISTSDCDTEEEAIEKWNRAMSGNRVRLHKVVFAEGEVNAPMSAPYVTGNRYRCGNCSTPLGRFWVFCQKCGIMIDWNNKKEL